MSHPNPHLMCDIETMSTRYDASILSIGAVIFNPYDLNTEDELREAPTFKVNISIESNELEGRHISGGTVVWWLGQSQAARELLVTDTIGLHAALMRFNTWMNEQRPVMAWANSPSFDLVILKHAFEQFKLRWPLHFAKERDVRTIRDAAFPNGDVPEIQIGTAHGALDDSIKQAMVVQACFSELRRSA